MASHQMLKLIASEEATEREHQARSGPRFRVLLSAMLMTTTKEQPVRLRNLSACGALIEGKALPPEGTDVLLKRGAFEAFARVVWTSEGRAGLHFEESVEEAELLAQIHDIQAQEKPADALDWRRPGFRDRPLSEEELRIGAGWAMPQGRRAWLD